MKNQMVAVISFKQESRPQTARTRTTPTQPTTRPHSAKPTMERLEKELSQALPMKSKKMVWDMGEATPRPKTAAPLVTPFDSATQDVLIHVYDESRHGLICLCSQT